MYRAQRETINVQVERSEQRKKLTRIHPLHSVGKCAVGNEVVAAPAWVRDDGVGGGQASEGEADEEVELHDGGGCEY